jgi:hypothetical protein
VREDALPEDLAPAFEAALRRARSWSLETVRRFAQTSSFTYLLVGHAGLVDPKAAEVKHVITFDEWQGELPARCQRCGRRFEIERPIVEASALDEARHRAAPYLQPDAEWPAALTGAVVAAIASEAGQLDLAAALLGFDDETRCPHCGAAARVRDVVEV